MSGESSVSAKTNDAGAYNVTRLPPGSYQLKVSAPGFQTNVHQAFTLVLNQTARVDVQMSVGAVSETVEVSGEAPVLQTERTEVSTIIDSQTNDRLPLATRNYVQLTLLAPGAVSPNPNGFNNGDNTASGARPYINGNREQANNFVLDGMNNNQVSDNLLGFTPTPDAIQEFNLITQNASAEFGNFQGGIVSTTIKSGTNSFHGDIWEYFRNDKLNSNSWENRFNGSERNKLRWNMFGGTVGGPIVKNKLFFFFDYQGQRFDHPSTTKQLGLFTAAERAGDFGDICNTGFTAGLCNDTVPNPVTGGPPLRTHQLYDPRTATRLSPTTSLQSRSIRWRRRCLVLRCIPLQPARAGRTISATPKPRPLTPTSTTSRSISTPPRATTSSAVIRMPSNTTRRSIRSRCWGPASPTRRLTMKSSTGPTLSVPAC